jgi:amidase
MALASASADTVRGISDDLGLSVDPAEAAEYATLITQTLPAYEAANDFMRDANPPPKNRRWSKPPAADNRHNAWHVKTSIKEKTTGKLKGKRIAIKDSVMVAGLPMMNGSNLLDGFVPQTDAEVVARILEAGGEIIGKTTCEYLCLSGGSHTASTGPVLNPWKATHSAGGSSSGSAVVLAIGEADMAIGADQAGSIRMPASFSGVVGMKATYSLVPYTGVAPIEATFDHVGPMSCTVEDNALLLEVIAGDDGIDPRQRSVGQSNYRETLKDGVAGLRVGVVQEGFGSPGSEPDVDERVREALKRYKEMGAIVETVSVPTHPLGPAIWLPISMAGLATTVLHSNGFGVSRLDKYPDDMMLWIHQHRERLASAPPNVKLFLMLAEHVRRERGHAPYGQAINAARRLRAAYDGALKNFDVLAMPTTPLKAQPLPKPGATISEWVKCSTEMFSNTAPFDITHHPAISLPCAMSDGLPVGLMLVGKHFDEKTLYRAAYAFEQCGDWKAM